jgi:nucleotide-binding universal stress UspA family protein
MAEPIRTIVLGVAALTGDDPRGSAAHEDPALASAANLARSMGATLHVVHAFELPVPAAAGVALPQPLDEVRGAYAEALSRQVAAQAAHWAGLEPRCHVVEAPPVTAVCDIADRVGAGLVVVGATRRGRVWRGVVGSTADGVVRSSPVPVLVLHEPLKLPIRRVLLTTDLSEPSVGLLTRALETIGAIGAPAARLELLLVVASDPLLPPPFADEVLARGAGEAVRRIAARLGRPIETRVRVGETPLEIVREASEWRADLLVLGTHGRSGFRPFWLGGTAASALRAASCNVLMIPGVAAGDAAAVGTSFAATETASGERALQLH